MDLICATALSLACLGNSPPVDGPLGITPHVAGRFGVVSVRSGGVTVTEPFAQLRTGLTWRHELDTGARIAVTVEVVGQATGQGLRLR